MRTIITLLLTITVLSAIAKATNSNTETINAIDSASKNIIVIPVSVNSILVNSSAVIRDILQSTKPVQTTLAYTKQFRPLDIHYFPGTSNENALVIGGVHGSELSSVAVAQQLI